MPAEKVALLKLAIDWRNRRVHSLAEEILERSSEEELLRCGESLRTEHSGLDVEALLKHYKTGESPSFKEAASVIRLTHNAVAHFDAQLLLKLSGPDALMLAYPVQPQHHVLHGHERPIAVFPTDILRGKEQS